MKKRVQGLIAGVLIGATITGGGVIAANTTTLYDVIANGVKIVVDGEKLNPTDVNGNKVEPFIYNGTTYLPVRAVANALGKEVYWDGPSYTVYLGDMKGELEYPTVELSCDDNIGMIIGVNPIICAIIMTISIQMLYIKVVFHGELSLVIKNYAE